MASTIRSVTRNDYEVKSLAYLVFSEAMTRGEDQAIIILCVSTFLKDFMTIKNFVKVTSLKTIAGVYCNEICTYIDELILKASKDKSAIVRRAATVAILKATRAPTFKEEKRAEYLQYLLTGIKDYILNSGLSLIVYFKVSGGEDLSFLHGHFRRVCGFLPSLPISEAAMVLNIMHRYAIKYLLHTEGS